MFKRIFSFFKKKPKPQDNEFVPQTFEDAVDVLVEFNAVQDMDHPMFHFVVGRSIRNSLGLWDKNSAIYKHMLERFGLCHADDTGFLITNAARAKMDGKSYDPTHDVAQIKHYWRMMGIDPGTMEKINKEGNL